MIISNQQAKGTARCAGERAGGDDSAVAQLQFGAPGGSSKGGQPTLAPAGFLASLGSQSDPASLIPTLGGATAGQAAGGAAQQEQPGGGVPGKHILRSPICWIVMLNTLIKRLLLRRMALHFVLFYKHSSTTLLNTERCTCQAKRWRRAAA